jgi:type VI secretion system protein ImpB
MRKGGAHKRIDQRPTRVNITYDVEVGDDTQKVSIPFVMGVMSDLSGDTELDVLEDRKFTEIKSSDDVNNFMESITPRISFSVDNKLEKDSSDKFGVELEFKSMEDFSPARVAEQVEPLKKLLERRDALDALKKRLQMNRKFSKGFNKTLQAALDDPAKMEDLLKELASELGHEGDSNDG